MGVSGWALQLRLPAVPHPTALTVVFQDNHTQLSSRKQALTQLDARCFDPIIKPRNRS
jgi:hypothetical protein